MRQGKYEGMRDCAGDNSRGEGTTMPVGIADHNNRRDDGWARGCTPSKPARRKGMLDKGRPPGRRYGRQTASSSETQIQHPYDSGFDIDVQSRQTVARVSSREG